MIAGSRSYRAHEEREMGFLHVFEELFPAIKVVGLREGHDDADRNYRQTRMLLGSIRILPDLQHRRRRRWCRSRPERNEPGA